MSEAFIIDAVRTPTGRRNGRLSEVHPADLGAHAIGNLIQRSGVDPERVDDVVFGNVNSVWEQAGCIARTSWLAAGLPMHVPGVTIDRQCGSAQQAVQFAAQAVMSGTMDIVVAGGVENMSMVPITAGAQAGKDDPEFDPFTGSSGWTSRFGNGEVSQFLGAEMMAEHWDISREDMEQWAVQSHERALQAQAEGRFEREIAPLNGLDRDEGPREPDVDKIRSLPTLREGGRITAAVASQISDGSSAVLIANAEAVERHGLTPKARIHHMSVMADDPIMMLSAPIPATKRALERAGMSIDDIDLVEINEAFAPVVLAWLKETGADPARVNVNGGAIALGHPLGATGARCVATLMHEMHRRRSDVGVVSMCIGSGMGAAGVFAREA